MISDLATFKLALAFMAFTASAQPEEIGVTFYSGGGCSGASELYTQYLGGDYGCLGTCMQLSSFMVNSVNIYDQLSQTACYFWQGGDCGEPGTNSIAVRSTSINTCINTESIPGSVKCYTGQC